LGARTVWAEQRNRMLQGAWASHYVTKRILMLETGAVGATSDRACVSDGAYMHRHTVNGTEYASRSSTGADTEAQVRELLVLAAATVALALCGCSNSDPEKAQEKSRLFDAQRNALEKARGVNETLQRADQARRAQEESQTQ